MKKNSKFLLMAMILGLSCVLSWQLYLREHSQKDTVDVQHFPRAFGEWTSEELTISEEEYSILETNNAFVRRYKASGKEVYLYIVYSQHNRKVSHPPEVCYIGSGITVVNNTRDFIPFNNEGSDGIDVKKLLLEQKGVQQTAVYWFKVGDVFTSSYWKQQILIALNSLMGKTVCSALIRVSSTIVDENPKNADKIVHDFSREIVPYLYTYLP